MHRHDWEMCQEAVMKLEASSALERHCSWHRRACTEAQGCVTCVLCRRLCWSIACCQMLPLALAAQQVAKLDIIIWSKGFIFINFLILKVRRQLILIVVYPLQAAESRQ